VPTIFFCPKITILNHNLFFDDTRHVKNVIN
jgi:hypothetical protein